MCYVELLPHERVVLVDCSIPEDLNVRPIVTDVSKLTSLSFIFTTSLGKESLGTVQTDQFGRRHLSSVHLSLRKKSCKESYWPVKLAYNLQKYSSCSHSKGALAIALGPGCHQVRHCYSRSRGPSFNPDPKTDNPAEFFLTFLIPSKKIWR